MGDTCSSATLSTTNPTWTGPLGVKVGLDSDYVLCYIIPCVNIEFFFHPLQTRNGCPSLLYRTPPQFHQLMWCAAVPDVVTCHSQMEAHCL